MRLKNKQTGEIRELCVDIERPDNGIRVYADDGIRYKMYNSLAELCEEWTDYEEPKKYWIINDFVRAEEVSSDGYGEELWDEVVKKRKARGNYFETEEEAEKAAEKVQALTRLENNGFKFAGWTIDDGLRVSICTNIDGEGIYDEDKEEVRQDLDLLFSGENEECTK